MTKKELKNFLKGKLKELPNDEAEYLKEEIQSFNAQPDWSKVVDMINSNESIEDNPNNMLALYLLKLAPYPKKLKHHWLLSDAPDIDMDIAPSGRDKVKDWLKKEFGENNCVEIGTYSTLATKGSIQEISRVYNIPPSEYIAISKLVSNDDKDLEPDELREKYPQVDKFLNKHPEVADTMMKLIGIKKSNGVHAGGVLVSSEDIYENVPVVKSNKSYATGWLETGAIKELERLGWIKIDVLGLSSLEQIQFCVKEVNKNYPGEIKGDIFLIPPDDPKVYDFINTLQLDNVFQMESKVFVEAVRKIKPQSIYDISNISTLIRPGAPCTVEEYHKAKNVTRREPKCLHKVYNSTRGYMIYQEQMLQVLMELGDLSIFEADNVRRLVRKIGKAKTTDENRKAMQDEAEQVHKIFLKNATAKIVSEDSWDKSEAKTFAETQWNNLMGQAKYVFNSAHCIDGEELIKLINGKKKRAKYLKVGDEIFGLVKKKIKPIKISKIYKNGIKKFYEFKTNKNVTIRCTEDHKFLTTKGLKTIFEIWEEKLDILEKSDF